MSADLAWTAGFLEGEGSVRFDSTWRVRASQRQRWPLERLRDLFGGRIYEARTPKGRSYGIWEITGHAAERLAFDLLPLMSPARQDQIWRAVIKRKMTPRRGSLENRAQCSRAGRLNKGVRKRRLGR